MGGGNATNNYRRISVDVTILDELDAFDQDIEGEGSPFHLAYKRLEGAVFPKMIAGTTPKTANLSHIQNRVRQAREVFIFHIPCPHCQHRHPLVWGGKGEKKLPHGFIWRDHEPASAGHLVIDDINPFLDSDWERLDEHLQRRYRHARGGSLAIEIAGIDTGYATH